MAADDFVPDQAQTPVAQDDFVPDEGFVADTPTNPAAAQYAKAYQHNPNDPAWDAPMAERLKAAGQNWALDKDAPQGLSRLGHAAATIGDIPHKVSAAAKEGFAPVNAAFNPYSPEATKERDEYYKELSTTPGYDPRPSLKQSWSQFKRVGSGLLGVPQTVLSPFQGAARSVIGHAWDAVTPHSTPAELKKLKEQGLPVDTGDEVADKLLMAARPGTIPKRNIASPGPSRPYDVKPGKGYWTEEAPVIDPKPPGAPTLDELHTAATAAYNAPEVKALQLQPQVMTDFASQTAAWLEQQGFDPLLSPKTFGLLEKAGNVPAGTPYVTAQNFQTLRRKLGKAAKDKDPTESATAQMVQHQLDDFMSNIPQNMVLAGDAAAASGALQDAKGNYAAAMRTERVQDKLAEAQRQTDRVGIGGNWENYTRQRIADLLKNPRGFSKPEIEALNNYVSGNFTRNGLRVATKILGGDNPLMASIHAGLAWPTHGISLAAPVTGYMLKRINNAISAKDLARLDEMIRARSPAGEELQNAFRQWGTSAANTLNRQRTPTSFVAASNTLAQLLNSKGLTVDLSKLKLPLELPGAAPAKEEDKNRAEGGAVEEAPPEGPLTEWGGTSSLPNYEDRPGNETRPLYQELLGINGPRHKTMPEQAYDFVQGFNPVLQASKAATAPLETYRRLTEPWKKPTKGVLEPFKKGSIADLPGEAPNDWQVPNHDESRKAVEAASDSTGYTGLDRFLGRGGQEREQLWPEKMVRGVTETWSGQRGPLFDPVTGDVNKPVLEGLMDSAGVAGGSGFGAGAASRGANAAGRDVRLFGHQLMSDTSKPGMTAAALKNSPHWSQSEGAGWWFNTADRQSHRIDKGDLGPHGDHDGWISLAENAEKLGVDPRQAAAFQTGTWGPNPETTNPHVKAFMEKFPEAPKDPWERFDFFEDQKNTPRYDKAFEETFGTDPISALNPGEFGDLVRIRRWPGKGNEGDHLSVMNTEGLDPATTRHFVSDFVKQNPEALDGVKNVTVENEGHLIELTPEQFLNGRWLNRNAAFRSDTQQPGIGMSVLEHMKAKNAEPKVAERPAPLELPPEAPTGNLPAKYEPKTLPEDVQKFLELSRNMESKHGQNWMDKLSSVDLQQLKSNPVIANALKNIEGARLSGAFNKLMEAPTTRRGMFQQGAGVAAAVTNASRLTKAMESLAPKAPPPVDLTPVYKGIGELGGKFKQLNDDLYRGYAKTSYKLEEAKRNEIAAINDKYDDLGRRSSENQGQRENLERQARAEIATVKQKYDPTLEHLNNDWRAKADQLDVEAAEQLKAHREGLNLPKLDETQQKVLDYVVENRGGLRDFTDVQVRQNPYSLTSLKGKSPEDAARWVEHLGDDVGVMLHKMTPEQKAQIAEHIKPALLQDPNLSLRDARTIAEAFPSLKGFALFSDSAQPGTAVSALSKTRGEPFLRPALKYQGKIYKAKEGQQHLDALPENLQAEFQRQALSGEDISNFNFGFWNNKGQFLNREAALDYAIKEGLVHPQAGKFGTLTTTLLADSTKPGTAIEALAKSQKRTEPFYSPVTKAVENAPQAKMHGSQWAGWLKNQPGVKGEELEWRGVDNWLKEQKGPVTKEALQKKLDESKVELGEVRKGGKPSEEMGESPERFEDITPEQFEQLERAYEETNGRLPRNLIDKHRVLREFFPYWEPGMQTSAPTKYHEYQLPGGENYGETLLTLPKNTKPMPFEEFNKRSQGLGYTDENAIKADYQHYLKNQNRWLDPNQDFTSSHWPEDPNVLMHLRHNDRTIDGKKALFLEELQSDWGQQGRKKGFAEPNPYKIEPMEGGEKGLMQVRDTRDNSIRFKGQPESATKDWVDYVWRNEKPDTVPNMPFKKTWPELGLKRMLRHAAENDHDALAWTPGEMQAARYDLSKQIDHIDYRMGPEGKYELGVVAKNGEGVSLPKRYFSKEELPEVVGKEVAEKIVNGEGKTGGGRRTLSNLDLKLGGEGMLGFYDDILPSIANKLGKKYGVKVEQKHLQGAGDNTKRTLADNADDFTIHSDVSKPDEYHIVNEKTGEKLKTVHGYDEAIAEVNKYRHKPQPVHFLRLTPEFKKDILEKGFSLFSDSSKPGAAVSALGKTNQSSMSGARSVLADAATLLSDSSKPGAAISAMDYFRKIEALDAMVKDRATTVGEKQNAASLKSRLEQKLQEEFPNATRENSSFSSRGKTDEDIRNDPWNQWAKGMAEYLDKEKLWKSDRNAAEAELNRRVQQRKAASARHVPGDMDSAQNVRDARSSVDNFMRQYLPDMWKAEQARREAANVKAGNRADALQREKQAKVNEANKESLSLNQVKQAVRPIEQKLRDFVKGVYSGKPYSYQHRADGNFVTWLAQVHAPVVRHIVKQLTPAEKSQLIDLVERSAEYGQNRVFTRKQKDDFIKTLNSNPVKTQFMDDEAHYTAAKRNPRQRAFGGVVQSEYDVPGPVEQEPTTGSPKQRAAGGRVEASNINHNPTEAQKEAGNYAKDTIHVHGLTLKIENAKGSQRRGVSASGKPWTCTVPYDYGYIKGAEHIGADDDHLDVCLGPHKKSQKVFVIDQVDEKTKKFDEAKIGLFWGSKLQFLNAYKKAFSDGRGQARVGAIHETTVPEFRGWLKHADTTKPFRD